jgi:(p)ppGpp synthase/HD superfamily hydrolase
MIARAIEIAAQVHAEQIDKGGEPYILHALAVMQKAADAVRNVRFDSPGFKEDVMIVGVLHDTIEDFTGDPGERELFKHMLRRTFGATVMDALTALTHEKNPPSWPDGSQAIPLTYEEYIERVARDPIARIVKIADLTHNMDTGRLPENEIGDRDFTRWDKYRRALVRLKRED